MISVIDYGAGNLQSVQNTLEAVGAKYELIRDAGEIERAKKLILPGVGHFGQIARALAGDRRKAVLERTLAGVPFLGICLGLQVLYAASEEAPDEQGIGLCAGTVRRFRGEMRIPHMGWNQIEPIKESRLFAGIGERPYVYFANSYYCPVGEDTAATCDYFGAFTAVLDRTNAYPPDANWRGRIHNVFGVQFHPEKSGAVGLRIVRNFVENVC